MVNAPKTAPSLKLSQGLWGLAQGFALVGGGVLVAVVLLTGVSIVGRTLFNAPIPGDVELVEVGCGIAIFAFLPYVHLRRGNVAVTVLTDRLPLPMRQGIEALGDLLYGTIAAILTWRLALGGLELRQYGESTFVLQVPLWWAFVPIVLSLALLTCTCAYTLGHTCTGWLRRHSPGKS
ncbi:MAG: TRAP transporter small permease [Prochlorothrix sp.]|nr:TRAP transporter small permease [Prochlorothrix sp.]